MSMHPLVRKIKAYFSTIERRRNKRKKKLDLLKTKFVQLCMLIRFFCQGDKKVYAAAASSSFSSFFTLSSSIYSATHFEYIIIHLVLYSHVTILPPLTFLSSHKRWLQSLLPISHIRRESLSTTHTTLSSMYIFFSLLFSLSFLMSIHTCSVSYKREEEEEEIQQGNAARG